MSHLLTEWFGAEAVSAQATDPKIEQRIQRVLAVGPAINLEVHMQLGLRGLRHPSDWKEHRDLVFGFVYGRAQRWCEECSEPSDWGAVFLTMEVLLTLLGKSWSESEVSGAFDAYLSTSNTLFETGRMEGFQTPLEPQASGLPRVPLLKYIPAAS